MNKVKLTEKMREIRKIAEQLPTGLIDKDCLKKMNCEATEVYEAIEGGDRIGALMEYGDVAYYAIKAYYNDAIDYVHLPIIIDLVASLANVRPELLLDICAAKMSLRTRDGNPKNDMDEREAVIRVLDEAGPHHAY